MSMRAYEVYYTSANLLRWSLKLKDLIPKDTCYECKFTPMEFETSIVAFTICVIHSANLLRWSLKLISALAWIFRKLGANLLRWSLKPMIDGSSFITLLCANLLRWSLKPTKHIKLMRIASCVQIYSDGV